MSVSPCTRTPFDDDEISLMKVASNPSTKPVHLPSIGDWKRVTINATQPRNWTLCIYERNNTEIVWQSAEQLWNWTTLNCRLNDLRRIAVDVTQPRSPTSFNCGGNHNPEALPHLTAEEIATHQFITRSWDELDLTGDKSWFEQVRHIGLPIVKFIFTEFLLDDAVSVFCLILFIHCRHLCSASSVSLLRSAPNRSAAE